MIYFYNQFKVVLIFIGTLIVLWFLLKIIWWPLKIFVAHLWSSHGTSMSCDTPVENHCSRLLSVNRTILSGEFRAWNLVCLLICCYHYVLHLLALTRLLLCTVAVAVVEALLSYLFLYSLNAIQKLRQKFKMALIDVSLSFL